MSPFLLYIARAGLYLSLFYAFYLLVMRRTTFFRLNRVLLLAGSYLCLVLPFVRLRSVSATSLASDLTMVGIGDEAEAAVKGAFPWQEIVLAVYVAGAVVTLVMFLVSSWKMGRLIGKGNLSCKDGYRLVVLEQDVPSFSWGRNVVMSRKDLEENPAILTHERMHVECMHSLDLLLLLPIQLLFWWNPLVWINRQELRLLHEYEADEGVIQKGIDATQYQLLLVRKAVGEHRFTLASGFQHAKLKNRIEMMLKPYSSAWLRWSYLALIPVLAAFMFACNPSKKNKAAAEPAGYQVIVTDEPASMADDAIPFNLIEQKPGFGGGDSNEFSVWVNSHLAYPPEAKKADVQGRVVLRFTVGADGVVRNVKVLRSAHELLDAEAVRVVSSSPKWESGKQAGEAVPVTYTFPVEFKLK